MPLPEDFVLPEMDEEILQEEMEALANAHADAEAGLLDVAQASDLRGTYSGEIVNARLVATKAKDGSPSFPKIAVKVNCQDLQGSTTVWIPTSLRTAAGTAWQTERNLAMFRSLLGATKFSQVPAPKIGPNSTARDKYEYYQNLCDGLTKIPVTLRCYEEADRNEKNPDGSPKTYAKQAITLRKS